MPSGMTRGDGPATNMNITIAPTLPSHGTCSSARSCSEYRHAHQKPMKKDIMPTQTAARTDQCIVSRPIVRVRGAVSPGTTTNARVQQYRVVVSWR